jgi:hypothetical protein
MVPLWIRCIQLAALIGGPNGGYFENSKPQYTTLSSDKWFALNDFTSSPVVGKSYTYSTDQNFFDFVTTGDGKTDVTAALSLAFTISAGFEFLLFVPTGSYIITSTVLVSFPCFFCSIVAPLGIFSLN